MIDLNTVNTDTSTSSEFTPLIVDEDIVSTIVDSYHSANSDSTTSDPTQLLESTSNFDIVAKTKLHALLTEASEIVNIIKHAKTNAKKSLYKKKMKKLQKEVRILLYSQHLMHSTK